MTDALTAHRQAAEQHAARYAHAVPGMLANMPAPAGTPEQVRAALGELRDALADTATFSPPDPSGSPALLYRAALLSLSHGLGAFLDLERDPLRSAVLFITYTAEQQDRVSAGNAHAGAFLEGADAGTLTPEAAHAALEIFPDAEHLTCFLGAHHAFSLAVEALADPADTRPRERLGEALEVMRREVLTVPTSARLNA